MNFWTEEEFKRVALNTKMSARTLAACREVLVHGTQGVIAGKLHGVLPAQISRGIGGLRERQKELLVSHSALKDFAVSEAKKIAVGGGQIAPAESGLTYEGSFVLKTPGYMIQRINEPLPMLVLHELKRLDQEPDMSVPVKIDYPSTGELATVTVLENQQRRGTDLNKGGVER